MLHWIAQREEAAAGALQAVAKRDQLFPAAHAHEPVELQIAREPPGILHPEICDVGISPDERMEPLHVTDGAAVALAPVNAHRSGVAHLDRDDARRGIGAEEQRVVLKSHTGWCATFRRLTTAAPAKRTSQPYAAVNSSMQLINAGRYEARFVADDDGQGRARSLQPENDSGALRLHQEEARFRHQRGDDAAGGPPGGDRAVRRRTGVAPSLPPHV